MAVSLPIGYKLISINYPTYNLLHESCGYEFSIRHSSMHGRLKSNHELCHVCNPPIISNKFTIPPDYKLISSNGAKRRMIHIVCNSEFDIFQNVAQRRINKKEVVCTSCNPVRIQIPIPTLLGTNYVATIDLDDKEYYNLHHIPCGVNTKVHRRTIVFRLKMNIEPCVNCCPFQRQYSKLEMDMAEQIKKKYPDALYGVNKFKSGLYTLDCYIPSRNLGIEFNGDYFHANPKFYSANDKIKNKTASHVWNKDRKKMNYFKSIGIKIIVIWEHDWLNNRKNVIMGIAP